MNDIEYNGRNIKIKSHLNEEAILIMKNMSSDTLEWDQKSPPDEDELKILNEYFKNNKKTRFLGVENQFISLLPDVEKFMFITLDFNEETIGLLKNNKVTSLRITGSPQKKFNLEKLLVFKGTLEEIFVTIQPDSGFQSMKDGF
jgi:hypothetical protein